MEKSRETQIMLDALVAHAGLLPTEHLECAINSGLKKIRRERFEERKSRKAARAANQSAERGESIEKEN